MSRSMIPIPERNSATARSAAAGSGELGARATSTSGAGPRTKETTTALPRPMRRLSGAAQGGAEDAAERADPERQADRAGAEPQFLGREQDQHRPEGRVEEVERGAGGERRPQQPGPRDEADARRRSRPAPSPHAADRPPGCGRRRAPSRGRRARRRRSRPARSAPRRAGRRRSCRRRSRPSGCRPGTSWRRRSRPGRRARRRPSGRRRRRRRRGCRRRRRPRRGAPSRGRRAPRRAGSTSSSAARPRSAAISSERPRRVRPGADVDREEEVRDELGGAEQAHLRGVGVEGEDGEQRDRQQRDLVAEERDRLPGPEAAGRGGSRAAGSGAAAHLTPRRAGSRAGCR